MFPKEEMVAEVDVLPSTDNSSYGLQMHLLMTMMRRVVDLQGLDGNANREAVMLKEMTQADVVLWVLKSEPNCSWTDKQLKDKFDAFYDDPKNISRKQPIVITVVNQVDRLGSR